MQKFWSPPPTPIPESWYHTFWKLAPALPKLAPSYRECWPPQSLNVDPLTLMKLTPPPTPTLNADPLETPETGLLNPWMLTSSIPECWPPQSLNVGPLLWNWPPSTPHPVPECWPPETPEAAWPPQSLNVDPLTPETVDPSVPECWPPHFWNSGPLSPWMLTPLTSETVAPSVPECWPPSLLKQWPPQSLNVDPLTPETVAPSVPECWPPSLLKQWPPQSLNANSLIFESCPFVLWKLPPHSLKVASPFPESWPPSAPENWALSFPESWPPHLLEVEGHFTLWNTDFEFVDLNFLLLTDVVCA